eukprot:8048211-Pyramimonas_sp.AAC.1
MFGRLPHDGDNVCDRPSVSELCEFLSVSIPPPSHEYDHDVLHHSPSSCSPRAGERYCSLMRTGGNMCTCTFTTPTEFRLHRAREQSLHRMISLLSIVMDAIGPRCSTHFATRNRSRSCSAKL